MMLSLLSGRQSSSFDYDERRDSEESYVTRGGDDSSRSSIADDKRVTYIQENRDSPPPVEEQDTTQELSSSSPCSSTIASTCTGATSTSSSGCSDMVYIDHSSDYEIEVCTTGSMVSLRKTNSLNITSSISSMRGATRKNRVDKDGDSSIVDRLSRPRQTHLTYKLHKSNAVDKKLSKLVDRLSRRTKSQQNISSNPPDENSPTYYSRGKSRCTEFLNDRPKRSTKSLPHHDRAAPSSGNYLPLEALQIRKIRKGGNQSDAVIEKDSSNTSRPTKSQVHSNSRAKVSTSARAKSIDSSPQAKLSKAVDRLSRPNKSRLLYESNLSHQQANQKDPGKKVKGSRENRSINRTFSKYKKSEANEEEDCDRKGVKNSQSSLNLLLSSSEEGTNSSTCSGKENICNRYYGRLYKPTQSKQDEFEKRFQLYREVQRDYFKNRRKGAADPPAHLRLYSRSKQSQIEGTKRRREIEEKKRVKSKTLETKKKISVERACRLYYIGMQAMKNKELKLSS